MRGVASRAQAAGLLGGTTAGLVAAPLAVVHLAGPPWHMANGTVAFVLEWVALGVWASIVVGLLRSIRDARRANQHRSSPLAALGAQLAVALTVLAAPAAGAAPTSTSLAPSQHVLTLDRMSGARPPATRSVVVKPGDSLWSIAEATTGSGLNWRAIAEANLGREMTDGRWFTDPSVILVGWVIELPSSVHTIETLAPPRPPLPPAPAQPPVLRRATTVPPDDPTAMHEGSSEVGQRTPRPAPASDAAWIAALGATNLAWLGMSIAASRRRQRLVSSPAAPVGGGDLPLARLCAEVAQSGLGLAAAAELAAHVEQASAPALLALGGRTPPPPPPNCTNPAAVALPLGVTAGTSQVLVAPVGSTIAMHGTGASALASFQRSCLGWWPWCETQVGTTDPTEVAELVLGWSGEPAAGEDRTVVFFGAPSDLDDELRSRCVTVTTEPAEAAVTVMVEGATTSTSTGEVVESFPLDLDLVARVAAMVQPDASQGEVTAPTGLTTGALSDLEAPSSPVLRLLCAVPRLEHLVHPIEPRRIRRATEVAAYLALHREQPTTGDRLRSVVLGSGDLDASPKTLANTLSALRRSLGADATGTPICTRGSKTGRYQVSAALRTDLEQLIIRVELAAQCDAAEERLALLRSAVELIEAPPLDAHLLGYDWLHAEGHLLSAAARLTEAVTAAVDEAIELGHVELAEHLVHRARMLDPFDDALVCCQLTLAATRGGRKALERSFAEHEREVHRLEPGAGASVMVETTRRRLLEELLDQASLAAIDAAPRSTRPSAPAAL